MIITEEKQTIVTHNRPITIKLPIKGWTFVICKSKIFPYPTTLEEVVRNLTFDPKSELIDYLLAFGLNTNARHREVVVTNDISRTIATYEESRRLADDYAGANETDGGEFSLSLFEERSQTIDKFIRTLGSLAVILLPFKEDKVLEDVDRMTDACKMNYPGSSDTHTLFYAICSVLEVVREGAFYLKEIKEFPDGENPLYQTLLKLSSHSSASKLKNDPIERAVNTWDTPLEPPNCLGYAVTMISILKCFKFRFYLASGLRLVNSDCRELRLEALSRSLDAVAGNSMFSWVEKALKEKIGEQYERNFFDWMYHHFIVVELDKETDEWAIFDPYMNASTYLPGSSKLTQLANALDARKSELPGLAVPVDLTGCFSKKQMTHLKGRLTRVEKHFKNLLRAYNANRSKVAFPVTIEQVCTLFKDDSSATKSFKWLLNLICLKKYQDYEVLDYLSEHSPDRDRRQIVPIEEQLNIAQTLGHEGIPWLISRTINVGMIGASLEGENLISEMGNPMFELYADHDYMLGLLLSSAAVASTGYRVLSPELLRLTSSQLIWQGIAEKDSSYDLINLRVARNTADSYIGELPSNWLHPLVLQRRKLLGLA